MQNKAAQNSETHNPETREPKASEPKASDIVIAGGGLTGLMMAVTLAHTPYNVTLIDRSSGIDRSSTSSKTEPPRPAHRRTTTIHAAGASMLDCLGVWAHLADKAAPIWHMHVAEGAANATAARRDKHKSDFNLHWSHDDAPMAFVVENSHLFDALQQRLADTDVTYMDNSSITALSTAGNKAYLKLASDTRMSCDLLVACDGANSPLRKLAGMKTRTAPHRQSAIVAVLKSEKPHADSAFQRFLIGGPIALMPMQDGLLSLVWTLPADDADAHMAMDDTQFDIACNAAFGGDLGYLELDSARLLWPLVPSLSLSPTSANMVLAGDAFHAIHPLAGQGYNLALGDAAVLADSLTRAHHRGLTAGHPSVLSDYAANRKVEVLAMSGVTSALNNLFFKMPRSLRRITGIGMSLVNASPLKMALSKIAAGGTLNKASLMQGKLPR